MTSGETDIIVIDNEAIRGSSLSISSKMVQRLWRRWIVQLGLLTLLILGGGGDSRSAEPAVAASSAPNIVLIVMDDIGIDQWKLFGYGGGTAAALPNITTIAKGGVRFRNMWAMPACSNARAALFTGRYPFRTQVYTALGTSDLSNSMVNPNETTLPTLLKQRGYKSALF